MSDNRTMQQVARIQDEKIASQTKLLFEREHEISTLTSQLKEACVDRDRLRDALLTSNCPRPIHENKTVKYCIQSSSCGCDNKQALKENLNGKS